ncbi:hypothetical protein CVT26_013094 [Gymnopilus dilepis]|uniref:Uncharacterized protein n=1 Tax=Gymnopilus dilepis TaxID=231916 RepID=A0A409WVN2_9AGAR|nr:hypothetical protein CVT26_013094 [Gymnopilus dilepis]
MARRATFFDIHCVKMAQSQKRKSEHSFDPTSKPPYSLSHELEASVLEKGKNFFVYAFLDVLYPSYRAPEPGTAGPVEQFAGISYPGEDPSLYRLDEGYTVPQALVDEYDLYNAALRKLGGSTQRSLSPSHESPEPESSNASGKGKERCIPSDDEESFDQYHRDGEISSELLEVQTPQRATSICYGDLRGPLGSVVGLGQDLGMTAVDSSTVVDDIGELETEAAVQEAEDEELEASGSLPCGVEAAWRKGGRPPNAFYREAAAIATAYHDGVTRIMKTFKVSQKVVEIATGLQPRVVETRTTSTWNVHQRVYKIQHPKMKQESLASFKRRQSHDYALHVKPLVKEEKAKYKEDYEAMVMDFFFDGKGNELKTLSPAKRVESACKALQKMASISTHIFLASSLFWIVQAQMITRADHEIQSFGGVNYIGSDKAGQATRGATFVSSEVVLRAIKLFNVATQSIMLKTTSFLRAAFSKQEMDLALEAEKLTTSAATGPDRSGQRAMSTDVSQSSDGVEAAHITTFNNNDMRKRGRSYLGFTYKKIFPQRTTVDWVNLLSNMVKSQFRLRNWHLSPHPGQEAFAADRIPVKKWQEIGSMLTADDFGPVTGGRNAKAPAFVPWTDEEKRYRVGSREYNEIPLIVGVSGNPLLCLLQAEQTSNGAGIASDDDVGVE